MATGEGGLLVRQADAEASEVGAGVNTEEFAKVVDQEGDIDAVEAGVSESRVVEEGAFAVANWIGDNAKYFSVGV